MIFTVSALIGVVTATMAVMAFTAEPICTLEEFHGCLQSLMSVTKGNDLALAVTRNQLFAVCSTLKDSVNCVDEHMKLCFTPTQRKVFNHVVAGARQVLSELCVPGPIQEGNGKSSYYLKHTIYLSGLNAVPYFKTPCKCKMITWTLAYLAYALCFRNISLSEEKCAPKYRHLIEISENVNEEENVDEGLRESCCAFSEFVLCKYTHVNHDCGHDAVEFLQKHLDRIASPLLHEHCAHYTYGDGTCSSTSITIIPYFNSSDIFMFMLYFFIITNRFHVL